jgi:lipopolysaccharide assembly outer membrane protein LptD (OstA)
MNYKKIIYSFLSLWLLTGFTLLSAQEPILAPKTNTTAAADTLITVEILEAKKLEMRKVNDSTQLQILAGKVKLKQGTSYFWCDSCVINSNTNTFEAWGNVHINDADTTNVYANHLLYLTKKKLAYLDGAVKLTDGKGTLTTPDLEYDMETKIGIYKHGGKVVNGNTTLTSKEGYYYTDLKDVYFKQNVELKDPKYFLKTDSLLYNTDNGIARFIAETFIKDSAGKTIETKDGYYNLKTGKAEFGRNPVIKDGAVTITGNRVAIDDSTGIRQVEGNAIIRDSAQGTTILAGVIYQNSKTDAILATKKPLMIIKQENDSIYITADTLFSARLTDLYGVKDSLVKDTVKGVKVVNAEKAKDSTNRYFEAYRNVRVFSDSLQAVCDSLFYSFKDSVFRMYDNPVVWAKESQVTGDTLYLFTKNKKAERFQVIDNSFLVNKMDPEVYNQVKSSRMDGWFIDGNIDSVRARGYAECIYYIQDEDSAYTGINESKCDIMDIYFKNQELHKVVFRSQVTGTLWPIRQKSPSEMRLENFQWLEARRPKTKFELFE